jgi:hypothetical protein
MLCFCLAVSGETGRSTKGYACEVVSVKGFNDISEIKQVENPYT